MNLHQLNVFRAIVQTGSFSKAAEQQRIAQSAVSYHIKALETEIGRPLFLRGKGRASLTEKGLKLWEHVEKIFRAVDEAQRELCDPAPAEGGELHFGLGVSSLSDRLPAFARELRELCPGICFHMFMGSTPQIIGLLRANSLDLGIVTLPIPDADVLTTSLFHEEEEMLVAVARNHPLAGKRELRPEDLRDLPLILYHKNTATRAHLDIFFRDAALTPRIFMEVDREDAIMSLVRSGLGATILPRCVFGHSGHDAIRLIRLRDAWLRREVGLAMLKASWRPKLVESAIALSRKHFAQVSVTAAAAAR
jgi:LysR family transcriptional regulator, cyn operon transcriptional activator